MASSALLHHEHPGDYRFVSYHPSGEYGGHVVYFDTDGRRANPPDRRTQPPRDGSSATVAVMGDSFVEALQVSYEDSFVGRLQTAAPHTVVHNYGTSSYSPLLYLLQWRHRVHQTAPTHVFLLLFGNDRRDDATMTTNAETDSAGNIIAVPGPEATVVTRFARRSYFARLIRKAQLQLAWRWDHRDDDASDAGAFGFVEENPDTCGVTD